MLNPDVAAVAAALPALRLTALELLGTALGGDMLAAEYLLLQLVSRCAHRAGHERLNCLACCKRRRDGGSVVAVLQLNPHCNKHITQSTVLLP